MALSTAVREQNRSQAREGFDRHAEIFADHGVQVPIVQITIW
jgi:hypothetical protein